MLHNRRLFSSIIYGIVFILITSSCGEINKQIELGEITQKYLDGNMEEAKTELIEFLETYDDKTAWTILGNLYSDIDDDSMAIVAYGNALRIDKEYEEAISGIGIIYRKKGDYKKAAKFYNRAIEINPKYAQAYSSLAVIELKLLNFDKAVEYGEKAYKFDKQDGAVAANLSVSYHYFGDTIKRDEFYDVAEDLGYKNLVTLKQIFSGELTVLD